MNLDIAFNVIQNALQREREVGRANSLTDVAESQRRRETIDQHWQAIQTELAQIDQRIRDLPPLPPHEQIAWAQAVLAMQNLAFLELDTTGLEATDEIIRFTLIDSNLNIIEDFLMKPVGKRLSDKASFVNGIKPEQLEREGLTIQEAWQRIQTALTGRYIISYSQPWDVQQLNTAAKRYQLEPVTVIGDDLQRHSTLYYHREYSLTLARICERVGHPLPEHPHQTNLDRAKGQAHFMIAMANAVTDVRTMKTHNAHGEAASESDPDELEDLDSHPF
jgi:DNA polymerase III alpha subunit (gram-positive type)